MAKKVEILVDPSDRTKFKLNTSYSSFLKGVNNKKIQRFQKAKALAEAERAIKQIEELKERAMIPSLCNLAEYNPKNIFFEDDIWEKYDGENTPWTKEQANKKNILLYNRSTDFEEWKPLFKGAACEVLINDVQLIIIPQRDFVFRTEFDKDNQVLFYLGINYANALAILRSKENFNKRKEKCENCSNFPIPAELYEKLSKHLNSEQEREKLKVISQEEFENNLCFNCQSRWLKEIWNLTIRTF